MRIALVTLAQCLPSAAFAQASTDVLWYFGNDGTDLDSTTFQNYVSIDLGGTVDFQGPGTWGSFALEDYRYVILARPRSEFSAAQISDLQAFIDNNGLVVIAGDSNAAGGTHITATNTLLTSLGRTMQLLDVNHATPDNDEDGIPDCVIGEVVNTSNFIQPANPLSILNMGDIDEGAGTPLTNVTIFVAADGTSATHTVVAQEGFVLLTADYDSFTSDICGLQAKQSFWNGMFSAICDIDQDGVNAQLCGGFDCDDSDAGVGASFDWLDMDGDGFGDPNLNAPCDPTAVPSGDDCDDSDPEVHPEADEVCDNEDNDCDGEVDDHVVSAPAWYPDLDNDGHGDPDSSLNACEAPQNHVEAGDDCNDSNSSINPSATELCNGFDDNCNGQTDEACPTTIPPPGGGGDEKCGCSSGGPVSTMVVLAGLFGLRRARSKGAGPR